MTQTILEARGLSVVRDARLVLEVPALQLSMGEVVAIIGPNGSGKSTLLLSLALLLRPSAGDILYHGKPVRGGSELLAFRRRTATVFQEPLLLDTSVERNVATGLELRGISGREAKRRIGEWLDRFGIAHLARRSARALSGGEAQRVSLARAFVLQPEILFLDEPLASLDAPAKMAMLEDVEEVIAETGVSTVFVTHERNEALALGHRVGVMMGGRISQLDDASAVFQSPVNEEVAGFVGVETVVPGVVVASDEGLVRIVLGATTVEAVGEFPPGQKVLVCLRPEDVTLSAPRDGRPSSARNRLRGAISRLSPNGPMLRVAVDCGFTLVAAITRQSAIDLGLSVGSLVEASFKASAIHLIRK